MSEDQTTSYDVLGPIQKLIDLCCFTTSEPLTGARQEAERSIERIEDEIRRLRQLCATQTETIANMTREAADNGQRLMRYHRDMRAIRAIADEMHAGPALAYSALSRIARLAKEGAT